MVDSDTRALRGEPGDLHGRYLSRLAPRLCSCLNLHLGLHNDRARVQQQFIQITPDRRTAAVILFTGGHGALGLKGPSVTKWRRGNFLVRSRYRFAEHGFVVAVMDAPSDHPEGMDAIFRMSRAHADDIDSVALYLKSKADIPVWLVGTSAGAFSEAGGAIAYKNIDGLVLTSTVTRARPDWNIARMHPDGVAIMALHNIVVPTLIMSHRGDVLRCDTGY